jgi:hypothetical protein
MSPPPITQALIQKAHRLYCELTGQTLRMGFDRERLWYELLRQGFSLEDLRQVIVYLQREIREGRRYVGALKLSNLLQPDRFEEDLNISRVRLRALTRSHPPVRAPPSPVQLTPEEQESRRQYCLEQLRRLREQID